MTCVSISAELGRDAVSRALAPEILIPQVWGWAGAHIFNRFLQVIQLQLLVTPAFLCVLLDTFGDWKLTTS